MLVTIAPGPASSGHASGTQPISCAFQSSRTFIDLRSEPKSRWSIAISSNNIPPAILKSASEIWKILPSIQLPAKLKISSITIPVKTAVLNAVVRVLPGKWVATSSRIGMFPTGSTIAKSVKTDCKYAAMV